MGGGREGKKKEIDGTLLRLSEQIIAALCTMMS